MPGLPACLLFAACLCALATHAASRGLQSTDLLRASASAQGSPSWLNCAPVHKACSTCRNQRIPGTKKTETLCSACKTGWKLRKDGKSKTCDCNTGFALGAGGECSTCPTGRYCPGGDVKTNPLNQALNCSTGLATKSAGAKNAAQCMTMPGFGRQSVRQANGLVGYIGVPCPVGTFNIGGNMGGCQSCSPGLTTATTGGTSAQACVAPAGSFMDKFGGTKCPRGTYTSAINTDPACTPCNPGVTTQAEGSTSPVMCDRAIKGFYYLVANQSAMPCPLNTFNGNETALNTCTDCPYGWKTQQEGADGLGSCLAPPGYELKPGAAAITECENGFYKPGFNRNNCTKCGINIETVTTGSIFQDACRVPAGYGIIYLAPVVAQMCVRNTFGSPSARPVSSTARCMTCPANFVTMDTFSGVPATSGYIGEGSCVLLPGYGTTQSNLAEVCKLGFWNPGGTRDPCQECISGYTTLQEGSRNASDCVIEPGWELDVLLGIPRPCKQGFFSTGGTAANRNGACQRCPAGFTTQEAQSTSADDCSLCDAGRGGPSCDLCDYGTWSPAASSPSDGCQACSIGAVSSRGANSPGDCLPGMNDPYWDVFNVNDNSLWQDNPAATTFDGCQMGCMADDSCIQARFSARLSSCQQLHEDAAGSQLFGYKAARGADYGFYRIAGTTSIGVAVGASRTGLTQQQCVDACNGVGECEAVAFVPAGGSCKLLASELDGEWRALVHLVGRKLFSDQFVS